MRVSLGSSQLSRLSAALDVAARPFDFGTPDQWRVEVLQHVMRLTEAKAGHFDVDGGGFARSGIYIGYDDDVTAAWASHWRHRDPALQAISARALTTYSRRWRYGLLGGAWEARYRRSDVFNEFYRRCELDVDAAGIYAGDGSLLVHLHVDHDGRWSDGDDETALAMMALLQPVVSASVRGVAMQSARALELTALLRALDVEAAVVDRSGKTVYLSAALEKTLLGMGSEQVGEWQRRATAEAERFARHVEAGSLLPAPANVEICGRRVNLSLVRDAAFGYGPLVVLRVEPGELPVTCPPQLAPLRLTERQWEVARLLTLGVRNQEIAETLAISVHTSRRHVEAVLNKFGVDSRAAVATRVWRALR